MSTYRLNALVTLALVGLVCVQLAKAQSDEYGFGQPQQHHQKRQGPSKYCGKHLSNTLQLVCHGLYNTMFKKSVNQEMGVDEYPWAYDDSYPFRSRASANAMMGRFGGGRFRRDSRGVHDECCVKACSISELLSYCAKTR